MIPFPSPKVVALYSPNLIEGTEQARGQGSGFAMQQQSPPETPADPASMRVGNVPPG